MLGFGPAIASQAVMGPKGIAMPVAWVNSTGTTVTDLTGGWYRITKTAATGDLPDSFGKTSSAFAGNFTLYLIRSQEVSVEVLAGLNAAPTDSYLTIDRGLDFGPGGAATLSFETGFTSQIDHGANTTGIYWIFQRVGSTISLYKNTAADVATAGAALRTWTDTATYYGEALILRTGQSIDVRML